MENDYTNRILIYGAVADVQPNLRRIQQFSINFKQRLHLWLDLLLWKFGYTARLDYRNYVSPQVVNRGDEAIAVASRMLFIKAGGNPEFLNCNWGNRQHFSGSIDPPKLIAICGGGYLFFGKDGTLAPRVKMDLAAMNESTIPVVLLGVGMNMLLEGDIAAPLTILERDIATLRALCERAALISVRDRRTQELLANYTTKEIYLVGDPALVMIDRGRLSNLANAQRNNHGVRIGVNFPFHGMDANIRIRRDLPAYINMLKDLQHATSCNFVYFVHFAAEEIVYKIIQSEGISLEICSGEPLTLLRGYESINVHLGGMLHSCIMASCAGTPSIAIAYDVKHSGFFESLGIEEYCIPAVPFDAEKFLSSALRAIHNESALRLTIATNRQVWESAMDSFVERCRHAVQDVQP